VALDTRRDPQLVAANSCWGRHHRHGDGRPGVLRRRQRRRSARRQRRGDVSASMRLPSGVGAGGRGVLLAGPPSTATGGDRPRDAELRPPRPSRAMRRDVEEERPRVADVESFRPPRASARSERAHQYDVDAYWRAGRASRAGCRDTGPVPRVETVDQLRLCGCGCIRNRRSSTSVQQGAHPRRRLLVDEQVRIPVQHVEYQMSFHMNADQDRSGLVPPASSSSGSAAPGSSVRGHAGVDHAHLPPLRASSACSCAGRCRHRTPSRRWSTRQRDPRRRAGGGRQARRKPSRRSGTGRPRTRLQREAALRMRLHERPPRCAARCRRIAVARRRHRQAGAPSSPASPSSTAG